MSGLGYECGFVGGKTCPGQKPTGCATTSCGLVMLLLLCLIIHQYRMKREVKTGLVEITGGRSRAWFVYIIAWLTVVFGINIYH